MAGTRIYEFANGPETPTLPTASDPSVDADSVTLGYANKTYTRGVASVAALKAIGATGRQDAQTVWVDSLLAFFYFDSASSASGNDLTVITPTAGTGRWLACPTEAALVTNTRASPGSVVAAAGITPKGAQKETIFIQGSGGAVTVTANPRIAAGTRDGQELCLIGRSDTNTVTIGNSQGMALNGDWVGGEGSVLSLVWDGTNWLEVSRNDL